MIRTPVSPAQALPQMRAILERGDSFRLTVTGNSMYPMLRHEADQVLLAPLTRPARRGDVLFYLRGPVTPVLHRVHKVRPDGVLLLCGDAQRQLEPVDPRQVLARATHILRDGRSISCDSRGHRLLVGVWMGLRPVRRYLLWILRRVKRLR